MSEQQKTVKELMNERVALTLYPELQYNFDSEPERTQYLLSLDGQLAEHGIDGQKLQEEAVARHYNIHVPLDNVVEVEFPAQAS